MFFSPSQVVKLFFLAGFLPNPYSPTCQRCQGQRTHGRKGHLFRGGGGRKLLFFFPTKKNPRNLLRSTCWKGPPVGKVVRWGAPRSVGRDKELGRDTWGILDLFLNLTIYHHAARIHGTNGILKPTFSWYFSPRKIRATPRYRTPQVIPRHRQLWKKSQILALLGKVGCLGCVPVRCVETTFEKWMVRTLDGWNPWKTAASWRLVHFNLIFWGDFFHVFVGGWPWDDSGCHQS